MKYLTLLISLLLLTACQSTLIRSDSNYFEVHHRASIEITEILTVAPNSARVFLQNGEVKKNGNIDLYEVNCEVEINTVSESRQTIQPEIFNVIRVSQEESPIVMLRPEVVASLTYAWMFSDSPVDIKLYYRFILTAQNSGSNSQVRAVICRGAQSEPYNAELPTLEQMKRAAGKYLRFNL